MPATVSLHGADTNDGWSGLNMLLEETKVSMPATVLTHGVETGSVSTRGAETSLCTTEVKDLKNGEHNQVGLVESS